MRNCSRNPLVLDCCRVPPDDASGVAKYPVQLKTKRQLNTKLSGRLYYEMSSSRWKHIAARAALAAWFLAMLTLGAALLARHVAALPIPNDDEKLAAALAARRSPGAVGSWEAVHVLYSDCRCSRNIATHLLSSERPSGWKEVVLWVGPDDPSPDLARRFDLQRVTTEDLAHAGIQAAPLLAVLDPANHLRYVGGYSQRKQGPTIDDLRILSELRQGATVARLPLFGCAVSARLRQQVSLIKGL